MAVRLILALCLGVLVMASSPDSTPAEPAGRITGVGGVFFKAKDPKALAAWYRDVLGLRWKAGAARRCATTRPSILRHSSGVRSPPPRTTSHRRPVSS